MQQHEAVIISDLHLGSRACQTRELLTFLDHLNTRRLILNGDIFDSFAFNRMSPAHWSVLDALRRWQRGLAVDWIAGNHDEPAAYLSSLLGVPAFDEIPLVSGDKVILVTHGHQFDQFYQSHPKWTALGDCIYSGLLWADPSHELARRAKHLSKDYLRCLEMVKAGALMAMKDKGADAVCTGHTHAPVADGAYFNSGSWTELPCSYLTVDAGEVKLRKWVE